MQTIGIVFGHFDPLHTGHSYMIQKALLLNDYMILGICDRDIDRGKDLIPFKDRQKLLDRHDYRVRTAVVDDNEIESAEPFDDNHWRSWSSQLFKNAGFDPNDNSKLYTWYTGELRHILQLKRIFTNHKFVLIDKSIHPISSEDIRSNPDKYQDDIDLVFRNYLRRKGILNSDNLEGKLEFLEVMRPATPEELRSVNDYIESISESSGIHYNVENGETIH